MRRFISGPVIKRLTGRPTMTISDWLIGGVYGETFFRGRIRYADLAAVERAEGATFSNAQIATAVDGRPDRLIVVPIEEAEHV
jgi:hypothetical protein